LPTADWRTQQKQKAVKTQKPRHGSDSHKFINQDPQEIKIAMNLRRIGGTPEMRRLVTGKFAEEVVDFARLYIFWEASDEEGANLVRGGLRTTVRTEHRLLLMLSHVRRMHVVRRRDNRAGRRWYHRHQRRRWRWRWLIVLVVSEKTRRLGL